MKKYWIGAFLLLFTCLACAQVVQPVFTTGYNSAVAWSRGFTEASSFTVNPAALPDSKSLSVAVFAERKYGLQELSSGSAAIAFPGAGGGIGITCGLYGFAGFNQSQFGIAYGRALSQMISLGVRFNYNLLHMEGYGNAAAPGFEIGTSIQATDKLSAGICLCNPAGGWFSHNAGQKLAAVYTMAFGYKASENLLIGVLTSKKEDQPVLVQFTMHYQFAGQFFVRGGVATLPGNLFGGVGLRWKNYRIDLIGSYHLQLGVTPALQFTIQPTKKEE